MNAEEFAYWLQGAIEMNPEMLEKGMTPQQAKTIQDHLNLVFNKVTPDRFEDTKIPDPNSSGTPPIVHPGSTCEFSPLFCTQWELEGGTKTAVEAGKHGLIC
jgi:hypothetical protein